MSAPAPAAKRAGCDTLALPKSVIRAERASGQGYGGAVIRAVVFDVGETLVDETREYGTWADWLGVPRHTFAAVFGAVIATGRDYREAFRIFRPGFDLDQQRQARVDAGQPEWFGETDLYPDARPTLTRLRERGVLVGVAGNQTARAGDRLRQLGLPADFIATSDDWGVQKPAVGFFDKVIESAACPADEMVYVGDRLDNDVTPAKKAGMRTVWIRRGPWGWILRDSPEAAALSDWTIRELTELPALVDAVNVSS
jgi:HAD superfamily hydrolase (TIGR01662 family)